MMEALNQAKNLIEKSQSISIVLAPELQGDNLGSALALLFTLKKIGKNVNVVGGEIPEKFQFLTGLSPDHPQDFVISVKTDEKDVSRLRYEKNEKDLKIYLTLNSGEIGHGDISFSANSGGQIPDGANHAPGQFPDLLIVLGTKSLEDLGGFFEQNSGLFYETPLLNIDNQFFNENFGQVNLIETGSSLAEVTTGLVKLMGPEEKLFDRRIATCLLTGLICASQNFRSPKTRPKTFETSAFLIERGADHQEIIQRLYRQKSVSQIKLLGRVLEKINFRQEKDLYAASLTEKDFQDCQSSSGDLAFVIEELKFNFRYLPNLLILWESHASPILAKGFLYSANSDLIEKIRTNFESSPKGNGVLFLVREESLSLAEEKILKILI